MKHMVWLLLLWFMGLTAMAHESRPAYLEINETATGRYDVMWRTPVLSGMRLPIALKFADGVRSVVEPVESELNDSLIERRIIDAGPTGLVGQRIEFIGLQASITDVLVRVSRLDGSLTTTLVHPAQPWIDIAGTPGMLSVAGAFLVHGIQHILGGVDHLLFVFGLLLLVSNGWMLVKTITAFTLAHSITLVLAALDAVRLPGPPVEATIALSILLLAVEIARKNRGETSFTIQWPWVVAFCFGLLHGFGFAGALAQIGLPQRDLPLALFTFNVGVEIGQLMFVAAALSIRTLLLHCRLPRSALLYAQPVASYGLGTLAAFWFFERVWSFWT
ncbi:MULTISPECIES: HupE/UreJ family protein [unclassified Pseudomonas]|uniref:HupE/UreJ family protein n=1 Tax=unclassified Pseudomonas TaxID=196821 RepID=UPI000C878794|nr:MULTISPECIES: HupE/UreJ family protein [unclassified Pseudomonas]PMU08845.1 HupE / UreJ protein [Pseudomonas sp. FW305-20]PMU16742.1 HupE / UreJ protein [Pseudomonas sp. FW305-122]PMU37718.1 HupE / UreJ protein [Pseudomonas sp. FW305-47B]PMX58749.1 HupE / UreJ protein [Pseudomonas sp. FW305-33]PMX67265.1 HupE / UreJ protein [Pseudomonas sp. FW305-60]